MSAVTLVQSNAPEADRSLRAASPLAVRGLTVSYDGAPALFSVDVTLRQGAMTAIVGPNGAGKSTLLKSALGIVKTVAGNVTVYGQDMARMRDKMAYVPQRASVDWDFPVRVFDVVLMGLYGQLGLLSRVRAVHRQRVHACLDRVGMADFADRQIGQLSGGQQQRVFLARALAQNADIYLLDEPFAGVDAATEAAIFAVLQSLRDEGRTLVVVHHDLATVRAYFDDVLLLNKHVVEHGAVSDVFTDENLERTYGGRLSVARADPESAAG